jgi:tRNA (guanine37-N1)-methyltransferase
MFSGPLQESILRRAQEKGLVEIRVHDLREWTQNRHRVVDDVPYGGEPGMVLKPEPLFEAVDALRAPESEVLLLTPQGERFDHVMACGLVKARHLVFLCGRYEGFDERVRTLADREISIGDYVLTGGELPALVVIDALVRLIPGALGDPSSAQQDSFTGCVLDYPQSGAAGSRGPAVRGPRAHPTLATEGGLAPNAPPTTGSVGASGTDRGGSIIPF